MVVVARRDEEQRQLGSVRGDARSRCGAVVEPRVEHHQVARLRAEHRALLLRTVLEALRRTGLPGPGLGHEVAAVDDRQPAAVLGGVVLQVDRALVDRVVGAPVRHAAGVLEHVGVLVPAAEAVAVRRVLGQQHEARPDQFVQQRRGARLEQAPVDAGEQEQVGQDATAAGWLDDLVGVLRRIEGVGDLAAQ